MVQLYLLCLVREGKLRLSLSGKSAPVDVLDYTNLAEISFKVPILDSISRVQRLRPPQGWEVLAPFAALLMEDESLRDYTDDESARRGLRAAMDFMNAQRENTTVLVEDVKAVFSVIGVEDSWLSDLERWNKFYQARIDPRDEMAYLRQALHDAFGYATMDQDSA